MLDAGCLNNFLAITLISFNLITKQCLLSEQLRTIVILGRRDTTDFPSILYDYGGCPILTMFYDGHVSDLAYTFNIIYEVLVCVCRELGIARLE